jgi:integrase
MNSLENFFLEQRTMKATIRNFYKRVKLFCSVYDIELSWKKITNIMPVGRRFANDRTPTHEELQKVIEYPDRRIKHIVLVTCSSGIRVGAWQYLKWKHIEPIKRDDKIVAAKIIVYAGENEQYFSFMTPEAFQALQEWMNYRKKSGEDINGESWLMRTLWDTTAPVSDAKSPSKMTTEAIRALVKRALKS